MRTTWLVILVVGMLAGCTVEPGDSDRFLGATTCKTGFSNRIDIHLSVASNDRSITAHLCDAIDVLLLGPATSQWQSIESSQEPILSVVPLPLPPPPRGGTHLIDLAERTGSTILSSVDLKTSCTNQAATCQTAAWAVRVTVVTQP
jgi:hypothetical protein